MRTTALSQNPAVRLATAIGALTLDVVSVAGDVTLFLMELLAWLMTRIPRAGVLFQSLYSIGVLSLPVVLLTGGFLGMVIAVQTYDQFRMMHLESNLGATINITLVRELGPVLTAVMLAGRIGGSMAAEIGTMKITEQIDALRVLGANPMQHLVVPRFLACVFLIPLLAVFADGSGVFFGWLFGSQVLGVNSLHYWTHSEALVSGFDIYSGIAKCFAFGAAIAVIACHRGFHCSAGAEGVGKASTEAFVYSFIAILMLDFMLSLILNELYKIFSPFGTY